ncbi:GDSL-type esterase/lipase family protein [Campylobacter sp. TTU_617]|uniref:GDSL-type esterase/lipase family protein n=2 Tax=unclassified Campylobacter TaxID=2593542 RepID=UPI0019088269|nr:GDSL-type esterase/lipase family protein [Campylobacter sp. TTU_617]MBK1972012.1 hypothetical protein [Campylobacter sp. TTU_617]
MIKNISIFIAFSCIFLNAISLDTKNCISNYADNKSLRLLKQKIEEKKNLGIRIYGDSHIAADFFPNTLRTLFFKTNALGFVYAIQPKYQQNSNLTYEFKNFEILNSQTSKNINYPLGGVIANALKKNAYIVIDTKLSSKKFNVGFIFKSPSNDYAFMIKDENNKTYKLKSKKNKWSYKEIELDFPFKITALAKDAKLGGYIIYNKNKNNLFLDTLAINGAKSNLWKEWNLKVSKEELKILKQDLIILAYGTNDALYNNFDKKTFKYDFKKFIHILKQINKNAVFIIISPPTIKEPNSHFFAIRKSLYEIAKEEKALIFDMHSFMKDNKGKDYWISQKLSLKDVHLSIKGYEVMAKKMYQDLIKTLNAVH